MSGYVSRAEAQAIVRRTIETGGNGTMPADLPRDCMAYNMRAIFVTVISSRGSGYGYGIEPDERRFWTAVRTNLRPAAARPAPMSLTPDMSAWLVEAVSGHDDLASHAEVEVEGRRYLVSVVRIGTGK